MATTIPSLTIPHLGTFPLSMLEDFGSLWPILKDGVAGGKSPDEIMTDLEVAAVPAVLAFAEFALNIILPGTGTLLEAIAWLVDNSKGSAFVKAILGYGPDGTLVEIPNLDYTGD